jgi:hypothetical protein
MRFGDGTPTIVSDIERKSQSDVEPVAITRAFFFRRHGSLNGRRLSNITASGPLVLCRWLPERLPIAVYGKKKCIRFLTASRITNGGAKKERR